MKTNKSNCKLFILISLFIIISVVAIATCYLDKVEIGKCSFTETQIDALSFDEVEKKNINNVLSKLYVENQKCAGFSGDSDMSVDLYQANFSVNLAKLLPNYNMEEIREKLRFISNINVANLDVLNLVYYCELCANLGYNIDYFEINEQLKKYYDQETQLFFIDEVSDEIGTKLIVTAMIKNVLNDNISEDMFKIENGIRDAYSEYSFVIGDNETFYNSGGDVLWAILVFDMEKIVDKNSLNNWYEFWKNKYESMEIDSYMAAIQYGEYLNVVRLFEHDYSDKKLNDYYDNLSVEKLNEIEDIQAIYNICKNVVLDNVIINSALESIVQEVINSEELVKADIDIKSTVFGMMLAQKTGYLVNEEKIQNYILENYNNVDLIDNIYEKTAMLYYNIILDQLINGYEQDYDEKYIQNKVDNILEEIKYEKDLAADCISTRRLIEIISDMQVFDVDVNLSKKQILKIKKGMKSALKDSVINESVLMNDILTINNILSLGIISDADFITCYNKLKMDGGNINANMDNIIPDLLSTYQFMISLNRMNNFEYLEEQKRYISSLCKDDGIYVLDKNSKEVKDVSVIVYGNAINQFEIGGNIQ